MQKKGLLMQAIKLTEHKLQWHKKKTIYEILYQTKPRDHTYTKSRKRTFNSFKVATVYHGQTFNTFVIFEQYRVNL